MFHYRFACTDKDDILFRINQIVIKDFPHGKTIFGSYLFNSGIHFQEWGDRIRGFYLDEPEEEDNFKGAPIRVCFTGEFVEDAGELFFDVYIYPNIFEAAFFIFAFIFAGVYGGIAGFIVASLVLFFFAKGYYDMMNDTFNILNRIFK